MKLPKAAKRYCPKCKKHTEHKISMSKSRTPGSARPMGRYTKARTGFGKGHGNLGRYGSKPPVGKWKMTGAKSSKKSDLRYQCKECKKSHTQRKGFRAKKFEFK
ncbi:MAG: 50S ribosomal protein L44e [Candidatus Woesearchaeota archaeon]|jgi:large subunit ribosomal protein L44e|nr:50S ribosomal protein L44e [Candidatus Woesearchaeota archaeon]MDP7323477.1 50S ribosomal protein L44e [Candidatus Woesearchaeota archaeon]MDP7457577.1 50S ribosomal protein L44e [Candidatus Woesearchaeota archaeon]